MEKVENGRFVSVDYKGTPQNGEVFDTSPGSQPFKVGMGTGQLIKTKILHAPLPGQMVWLKWIPRLPRQPRATPYS